MQLNKQQQQAVKHIKGPLLIVAGAGTGKTSVITKRIEYLINNIKIKPNEILALTFTEKAAGEMIDRLDEVMPYGYEEPWISTFHGFCDRILRNEGLEIGLSTDYKIISEPNQWILLKKNIFNLGLKYYLPLNNPNKFIHALLTFFSRLQDEDINKIEIDKFMQHFFINNNDPNQNSSENKELYDKYHELFSAYSKYQDIKLIENVLDFGDLISLTLKLFRTRSSILSKYQAKFKYVLVDEFQDTNYSQLQLIKTLCPHPNLSPQLTVVGDDNQSIYAFRGSSIFNILDFKDSYPDAEEIVLTTNYRSLQPILNVSHSVIKNNDPDTLEFKLGIDKQLVAARGSKGPNPQIIQVKTLEHEAEFVVNKILELVGKDYSYQDVAILARANAHLDPFVAALKRSGIPYQLLGNRGLFDQDEVRDLMFFLRVCMDTNDGNSLFYFLHNHIFNLHSGELLEMLYKSKTESITLWEVFLQKAKINKHFLKILNLIKDARRKDTKLSITEIMFQFINKSEYLKPFLDKDNIENQLKIKNVNLFFDKLKAFDSEFPKSSISDIVEYLDMLLEAGDNPAQAEIEDVDTVNLLTIHSSKGLEWPIVFIINMVNDRFPTRRRKDAIELPSEFIRQNISNENFHIQEERRLFYVALTRARDYIFNVFGLDYGGKRKKKPSIFLREVGSQYSNIIEWKPTSKQMNLLEFPTGVSAPKILNISDGKIDLHHLSYSQIDVYQTCPLKYKYQYILKVPTKPHYAFSFGQTIHNTLQSFHNFEISGQKPSLDVLLHIYQKKFIPVGFESEQHKNQVYKSGLDSLTNYYNNRKFLFKGFPTDLEKSFRIKIDGVTLIGRIDRIDSMSSGELEIIDYKTGKSKDQKKVDKDAQLTIYAMASQILFGKIPESLCLYFITDGIKVSTTRTQVDIDKKKDEISKVIQLIKDGNFKAKPGYNCKYCPFNKICPKAIKS